MNQIQFFTDEDIYGMVAVALRRAGFDAVSTPEVSRLGESDESQLSWAADEGRAIVSFNVAHFALLHSTWIQLGKQQAGIIVSSQRPLGDLLRRLSNLAGKVDADGIINRLEFLSDW